MNNKIEIIREEIVLGEKVTVYGTRENPLFLASDVGEWLEHGNYREMIRPLDDDEKGVRIVDTLGGPQQKSVVTEYGLYEILMLSRKPQAKEFKKGIKDLLRKIRLGEATLSRKQLAQMVIESEEERERLQEKIKRDAPMLTFAQAVTGSENLVLVREYAKVISNDTFVIGEKRLYQWFREKGYLNRKNEPYQEYVEMGLFEVIERTFGGPDGTYTSRTTKITGKGQTYFAEKIKKDYNNLFD